MDPKIILDFLFPVGPTASTVQDCPHFWNIMQSEMNK